MKIALAQVNPLVGDVAGNAALVSETIARAGSRGARLVVFPEMVLCGYPPRDLLERPTLVERCEEAVRDLARSTAAGPAALVGHPARSEANDRKPLLNAVSLLAGGRVRSRTIKRLLPSYDVFDEDRWFAPGDRPGIIELEGLSLGVAVCEDIWNHGTHLPRPLYAEDPVQDLAGAGIGLILNPSASPFARGKPAFREKMLADVARSVEAGVLFVNQVGGNDELVFDGGSLAVDARGRTRARGPLFETSLVEVALDEQGGLSGDEAAWPRRHEEVLGRAIVTGIRDYVVKSSFEDVVIGLSGGIDSALVACLAVEALGSGHVTAVAMPSRYSSQGSLADARELAGRLGIRLEEISIEPAFEALLETLAPHLGGAGSGLARENLQARIRGTLLMALSNRHGSLVLATGNKSELAVGYCTLHGDMVGALAPIGDVLKSDVYALARHLNSEDEIIPGAIIDKAPSAELRPGQTDQDTLPPYDELDRALWQILEQEPARGRAVSRGTLERVRTMVRAAEHKRLQAPIVLKVSSRAFGPGRRYPVAQGFEECAARNAGPPLAAYRPFEDLEAESPGQTPARRRSLPTAAAPGDEDLFLESVEGVTPLEDAAGGPPAPEPRPARLPDEDGEWRSFARDLLEGNVRFDITWSDEFVEGRIREVSEETMQGLRRGAFAWQDHIDLHGMTRPEARQAVDEFIERARRRSMRCVLIVHGRGKGSEGGLPVLKEKLVAWLARRGGIGSKVLAFTSARPCDGGYGAMYVLLRGA